MKKVMQRRYGGPDVLEVVDVAAPGAASLRAGEVLVWSVAAGVNPVDAKTRNGTDAAAALGEPPISVGWDVAGRVTAVGAGVDGLSVGDRVYGMTRFPTDTTGYAEQVVVQAADLLVTPDGLTDEAAAALPLVGLTAWQDLADVAAVQPGQRVLVLGAGGGVGHLAVQIATTLGATVIATAGHGKADWLRELGADRVVDYTTEDVAAALANNPVDVVVDGVSGAAGTAALQLMRAGGVFIDLAGHLDPQARDAAAARGVRVENPAVHNDRESLEQLGELVAAGRLLPRVSRIFDLDEVVEAHRALDAGHITGKLVLRTQ